MRNLTLLLDSYIQGGEQFAVDVAAVQRLQDLFLPEGGLPQLDECMEAGVAKDARPVQHLIFFGIIPG
ncbi:MAG: hypothetical protein KatS3mg050_3942 [Litorilinea sp.]|nr:MAG: hypothetical protein KatS3mg050_3942 [Litorilinea sp.]